MILDYQVIHTGWHTTDIDIRIENLSVNGMPADTSLTSAGHRTSISNDRIDIHCKQGAQTVPRTHASLAKRLAMR